MTDTISIVGSPTALGGHFAGMDLGPEALRRAGLIDRLRSRPGLAGVTFADHGDAPIEAGWAPDPDPVMKNRQRIIDYLPRLARHVERVFDGDPGNPFPGRDASGVISGGKGAVADPFDAPTGITGQIGNAPTGITGQIGDAPASITGQIGNAPTGITGQIGDAPASSSRGATGPLAADAPRLLVLGGDCTTHSGTMAALKRRAPEARFAIAWFDAHGDFNIPETTPSGNVWGMPFAMLCGRGDPGLVAACDGPTVREEDAALLGAQVLDEQESRMLGASRVALFGAGMLAGPAGLAALEGWARVVGERCDGLYIAFDLDAIDASEGVAVAMPEPDGLSVATAIQAIRILATNNRVVGFGPTATMPRPELDMNRHVDIVARLTEAALETTRRFEASQPAAEAA